MIPQLHTFNYDVYTKFLAYSPSQLKLFTDSPLLKRYSTDPFVKTITLEGYLSIRTLNLLIGYETFSKSEHCPAEYVFGCVLLDLQNPDWYLNKILEFISISDIELKKYFLFLNSCIPDKNFGKSTTKQLQKELKIKDGYSFMDDQSFHQYTGSMANFCKLFGKPQK